MGRQGFFGMAAGLLIGLLGSGCPQSSTFTCQTDDQCIAGERAGQCTAAGYCAFEDEDCESGWAFGELAGDGLAGTCVETNGSGTDTGVGSGEGPTPTTATATATTTTTTPTAADDSTGPGSTTVDDTGPPLPCSDAGSPCTPEDPCALAGVCDDDGSCLPTEMMQCQSPPGDCYLPAGECQDGQCFYTPQSRQFPCNDGNDCTIGDFCDGGGNCESGSLCPANDPCVARSSCQGGNCIYEYLFDGSSCGMTPSLRCCDGQCVDISSDDDHCGGCGMQCDGGQDCISLEDSPCGTTDPDTSGRCSCEGGGMCPNGQSCADVMVPLCEPTSGMECTSTAVMQIACYNYCAY